METNDALDLLNDLLNAQDQSDSNDEDGSESEMDIASITPTDTNLVIATMMQQLPQSQQPLTSEDEDDIDNEDSNDPDYEPSCNTSIEEANACNTSIEEANACNTSIEEANACNNSHPPHSINDDDPVESGVTNSNETQPFNGEPALILTNLATQPLPQSEHAEISQQRGRPKKRQKHPEHWKRNTKKLKIAKGEEHATESGRTIPARKIGKDCRCRLKCFEKITEAQREELLRSFNDIARADLQDVYLNGCIQGKAPDRKRPRNNTRQSGKGSRKMTFTYNVRVDNEPKPVCLNAFMAFHGIGKTRLKRVRKPATIIPKDMRGRHGKQLAIDGDLKRQIVDHIGSFPKRVSHYSRSDNGLKRYLEERLNVKRMWLLYLGKYEPEQRLLYRTDKKAMKPKVKYAYYLTVFNNEFNLSFGQPRSDTCPICDRFDNDIKSANGDEMRRRLEGQKEIHQRKAESAYTVLRTYIENCKEDNNLEMYTFDFQQNLPTPCLTAGDMFYSRSLWTYNFGLHDCKTEDGIMHLWSEAEAGRGSSEVTSCLLKTLIARHEVYNADNLVLFSDGCAGQNKNKTMVCFLLGLVKKGIYKSIQHLFLCRGHTFLPNDRDFSHIEKRKRVEKPCRPDDWIPIIKDSRLSQPYNVSFMDHNDFWDVKSLADSTMKSSAKCNEGVALKFKDVMWFSFGRSMTMNDTMDTETEVDHVNEVWCRYSLNTFEPWKKVDFLKRNCKNLETMQFQKKYNAPIGIKPAKKNDLLSLIKKGLIATQHRSFYQSLPVRNAQIPTDEDGDDYAD